MGLIYVQIFSTKGDPVSGHIRNQSGVEEKQP